MADSIQRTDSIEGSGFPLAFKVRQGTQRSSIIGCHAGRDIFRVELRAMGGHQKECVVTEGEAGSAYRLVCDEGANLNGTDLAPFPLGFTNAGLQADIANRFMALAAARNIRIDAFAAELVNGYAFNGSFFRGDGKGSAEAPRVKLKVTSSASREAIGALAQAAFDASPLIALVRGTPHNTFALYVNGRRRAIAAPPPSLAKDVLDPLKVWTNVPRPLPNASDPPDLLAKLVAAPEPAPGAPQFGMTPADPSATIKRDIAIHGVLDWSDGTTQSEIWASKPLGSRFGLKSDERLTGDRAPSGLALAVAGIAFCLTTQLLRYIDVHKMKVRAVRMVQLSPFETTGHAATNLRAIAHPLDTHVFVHGDDTDERMEKLLVMAQNTCYLHALLHNAYEPVLEIEHNAVRAAA